MYKNLVEVKSNGTVNVGQGINPRVPFAHQRDAMQNLDIIDKENSFSTMIVLPTGGGKTFTASSWLLRNAINKRKKVLWIAHRHMLLDQAAESFQKYAYHDAMPNVSSFTYRVVSGLSSHDRTIDIKETDDIIVASKDSIGRNLEMLDKWMEGSSEVYLVVDEAHHSTAKTYRRVIDYIKKKAKNTKIIGLTATPFKTAESEKGLLSKIYTDGVKDGKTVKGDIGITYEIGLKELISRQILSKPIFVRQDTEISFGQSMGLDEIESITHLDILPEDIAQDISDNAKRNRLIVDTYVNNQEKYGKTILFAINVNQAIVLAGLFKDHGISADFIVADIRDKSTGIKITDERNKTIIERYKLKPGEELTGKEYENLPKEERSEIQVLINVNILTEGVDLPQTKSVFLTRPTVSTILMTQMIGRALRGTAAGGTSESYIVSFIDNWNEHIAWVNPESLFEGSNEFNDDPYEYMQQEMRFISIAKMQEFASILDDSLDTLDLERIKFVERIPVGKYSFKYSDPEENGVDHLYQVMVYNSTKAAYEDLMESLPELFESFNFNKDEEFLDQETIEAMEEQCHDTFFLGEMIPSYDKEDVFAILRYYAQFEAPPEFTPYSEIDSSKLDVAAIAKHICAEDMGPIKKQQYLDSLWEDTKGNLLNVIFGRKIYFLKQVDVEILKITNPEIYVKGPVVIPGGKPIEDLPLWEIRKYFPEIEKELRDGAYNKAKNEKGNYVCQCSKASGCGCGCTFESNKRIKFHVDHIIPMNKGGKTVPENLQILCRACNLRKRDRMLGGK